MSAKIRESTFPTTATAPPPPYNKSLVLLLVTNTQVQNTRKESKGIWLGEELGSPTLSATLNSGILLSSERSADVLRSTNIFWKLVHLRVCWAEVPGSQKSER